MWIKFVMLDLEHLILFVRLIDSKLAVWWQGKSCDVDSTETDVGYNHKAVQYTQI